MITVVFQMLGAALFFLGTLTIGRRVRRNPERDFVEKTSRVGHVLIYSCLVLPASVGILYPGLTNFDRVLGLRALPLRIIPLLSGTLLLTAGLVLMYVADRGLRYRGRGASAFRLTKKLVVGDLHRRIRNPMSLGFYLTCLGISLTAGSTYLTLGSIFVLVPVHLFYLKYFEEFELEVRFGHTYRDYKRSVPFMIPRIGGRKK